MANFAKMDRSRGITWVSGSLTFDETETDGLAGSRYWPKMGCDANGCLGSSFERCSVLVWRCIGMMISSETSCFSGFTRSTVVLNNLEKKQLARFIQLVHIGLTLKWSNTSICGTSPMSLEQLQSLRDNCALGGSGGPGQECVASSALQLGCSWYFALCFQDVRLKIWGPNLCI